MKIVEYLADNKAGINITDETGVSQLCTAFLTLQLHKYYTWHAHLLLDKLSLMSDVFQLW